MASSSRYQVAVYDCAGEFVTVPCIDFAHALVRFAEMRQTYPGKIVRVENLEYVDLGCADGLTEEERDQLP